MIVEEVSDPALSLPPHDVTARKVHQWTMVALVAIGFLLPEPLGAVPLALAGAVMLLGRFWWPADLVRQLTWRVLEPRGLLRRREVHEDHETRRLARVLGGAAWLAAAALLLLHVEVLAWVIAFAIVVMVALDSAVDFCVLCFVLARARR